MNEPKIEGLILEWFDYTTPGASPTTSTKFCPHEKGIKCKASVGPTPAPAGTSRLQRGRAGRTRARISPSKLFQYIELGFDQIVQKFKGGEAGLQSVSSPQFLS